VRDPLLALGCYDPAERVAEAKERDTQRQSMAELFTVWEKRHGNWPVAVRDLHHDVCQLLDPHGRGRQFLSAQLGKLEGTRMAGRILTRQPAPGRWGAGTYALVSADDPKTDRDHRDHPTGGGHPMSPMVPMASATPDKSATEEHIPGRWSARI
jgi:hypothetical protein